MLSNRDAWVLYESDFFGSTEKQISERLDVSVSRVSAIKKRARIESIGISRDEIMNMHQNYRPKNA